jgi:hypothetical protein
VKNVYMIKKKQVLKKRKQKQQLAGVEEVALRGRLEEL